MRRSVMFLLFVFLIFFFFSKKNIKNEYVIRGETMGSIPYTVKVVSDFNPVNKNKHTHYIYDYQKNTKSNHNTECSSSENLNYESSVDIYGFQFNHEGCASGASGGDAAANGFTVSTSASVVLGFSFTGSYIPAGSGVLTVLEVQGDPCLSGLVLSGAGGTTLDGEVVDCTTVSYAAPCDDADADGVCDDVDDCVGEFDECGGCNGGGISDGTCDCAGNVEDCDGVCGGWNFACNYDLTANVNGVCLYPEQYYNCNGFCVSDIDSAQEIYEKICIATLIICNEERKLNCPYSCLF